MTGFSLDSAGGDAPGLHSLVGLLRVAHHLPGRLRLKLGETAPAAVTLAQVQGFIGAMSRLPGIRGVTLNALARSCLVEYDPAVIPPAAWQDLVAGVRSAAADALLLSLGRLAGG